MRGLQATGPLSPRSDHCFSARSLERAGHVQRQAHQLTCLLGTETFLYPLRPERQGVPFPNTFFTAGILGVKFILCEWFHRISQMIVTTFTEFSPPPSVAQSLLIGSCIVKSPLVRPPYPGSHLHLMMQWEAPRTQAGL